MIREFRERAAALLALCLMVFAVLIAFSAPTTAFELARADSPPGFDLVMLPADLTVAQQLTLEHELNYGDHTYLEIRGSGTSLGGPGLMRSQLARSDLNEGLDWGDQATTLRE